MLRADHCRGRDDHQPDRQQHARIAASPRPAAPTTAGSGTDPLSGPRTDALRYPSHITIRVVAEAADIGGQTLAEGELVYLVLAVANRDPDRFPDPDQLDLSRSASRHLGFGGGPRFCLGAPLARMQSEIVIGTLVQRLPTLRLDAKTVQWKPNPMQRGRVSLPLCY